MREYTTQMDAAKKGIITREMEIVANKESKNPEEIRSLVAEGKVAIPANINHKSLSPEGVGQGLKTKINVNTETCIPNNFDNTRARPETLPATIFPGIMKK